MGREIATVLTHRHGKPAIAWVDNDHYNAGVDVERMAERYNIHIFRPNDRNGELALARIRLLEEEKYDLIICGLVMSQDGLQSQDPKDRYSDAVTGYGFATGLALLLDIKNEGSLNHDTPVIVLTNVSRENYPPIEDCCKEAGADKYLQKGAGMTRDLIEGIDNLLINKA